MSQFMLLFHQNHPLSHKINDLLPLQPIARTQADLVEGKDPDRYRCYSHSHFDQHQAVAGADYLRRSLFGGSAVVGYIPKSTTSPQAQQ